MLTLVGDCFSGVVSGMEQLECTLIILERKTFHLISLFAISMPECLVANKMLYCIVMLRGPGWKQV